MMKLSKKTMTPIEIIKAIENLAPEEKETLSILADKELSNELIKRRKQALKEIKNGELIIDKGLFSEI
ncbi:MAG: hypothetical protein SV062_11940 [Thermodesulfobacteriota bacterium]|nr:hypothetical protein [Thermodesulfobacteriota bacterium]